MPEYMPYHFRKNHIRFKSVTVQYFHLGWPHFLYASLWLETMIQSIFSLHSNISDYLPSKQGRRWPASELGNLLNPTQHRHKDLVSSKHSYCVFTPVPKTETNFCFLKNNQNFLFQFNDNSTSHKRLEHSNQDFLPFVSCVTNTRQESYYSAFSQQKIYLGLLLWEKQK